MHGDRGKRFGLGLPGLIVSAVLLSLMVPSVGRSQSTPSSYDQIAPVLLGKESFQAVMAKDKADKESVMARQKKLLEERYDLTPRPDAKVTMSRGKPIPVGPTAKLPEGVTWDQLAAMSCEEIRDKGLFPKGYLPLPHPKHEAGGMVFPQMEIKLLPRLERFDLDFDLPDNFLPEFPPAIFLTSRSDLGDVSQGKVVTVDNFQEIFAGILNAKDLEGLRLLVTQFPQQQFNATADRKAVTATVCKESLALIATSTATPRQRPIWRETSGRRATAAASTRPASAESTSRGYSARSGRSSQSRTSPSSSSGPRTSTVTRSPRRPRGSAHSTGAARSTSCRSSRSCSTSRRLPA